MSKDFANSFEGIWSEQAQLIARSGRDAEQIAAQRWQATREAKPGARHLQPPAQQVCPQALSGHPDAKRRIIIAPAVQFAHAPHHAGGASDLMRTVLGFAATGSERPLIAKGNAGIPKYHDGHIHYDGTPELMAEYAVLARDAGVRIIGGCCGTMPDHLRAMRDALETRPKGPRPTLEDISAHLGGFSSASDGTGDTSSDPKRERRGRRG